MSETGYWSRFATARLNRRRAIAGAASLGLGAVALSAVGCGGDDDGGGGDSGGQTSGQVKKGGVSRGVFLGGNVFDSVDVHRAFGDPTSWLSNYVLNKVVRYKNPDTGEIEGDLAESYEAPDAQTYTFKIRRDVKWQNTALTKGRQLTAEDIKWHWERQAKGTLADGTATPFRHNSFYKTIAKIEMTDQYTIKATLAAPDGTFIDRLAAYFSTVPNRETTEKFEADHRTLTEESMPATGPYTLKQWRSGQEIKFVKNPDHFRKDEPNLDGWIYPILFEDPNAHRIAFEQKQVDGFSSPDPSLTKSIIDAHKGQMWEVLTGVANTVFLHLNMNQQFKDVRLVKALNLAFDRRAMIQTFHQGLGQVSGPVTWLQEGYAIKPEQLVTMDGYRAARDQDIKTARELWAAGGGSGLGTVDIKIPDTWLGPWPDTSQVIPNMFNTAMGSTQFRSTRTTYNDEIIPNLSNGTFPNWFGWTSQVSGPDPRAGMHSTFHSKGSGNFQKVNNAELDRLLDQALLQTDLTKAVDLSRQAQTIILRDFGQYGNIVLYNYISRSAGWNYFHPNVKVAPTSSKAGEGFNIFAGHLAPKIVYLDPSDASYQGRPQPTL